MLTEQDYKELNERHDRALALSHNISIINSCVLPSILYGERAVISYCGREFEVRCSDLASLLQITLAKDKAEWDKL